MAKKTNTKIRNLLSFICSAGTVASLMLIQPGGLLADESKQAIPENVDINIQATCPDLAGLSADKKEVKNFSHKLHVEKYLLGESAYHSTPYTDDFTCAACHLTAKSQEEILGSAPCDRLSATIDARNYKKQMHSMCLDCHKGMKKAKEATGPTSCKECHNR
ncbi:MAG: cytochrome c family protein [Desulfobulbaceae bacterium]|nr:cytochrome c family protein [Desulfobulbaceae bacterium]